MLSKIRDAELSMSKDSATETDQASNYAINFRLRIGDERPKTSKVKCRARFAWLNPQWARIRRLTQIKQLTMLSILGYASALNGDPQNNAEKVRSRWTRSA